MLEKVWFVHAGNIEHEQSINVASVILIVKMCFATRMTS